MRLCIALLCFFLTTAAYSQRLLKGIVLDADKNTPVPKASVFLNNTSVGTTANDEGRFELYIPAGKYELIVSSVGFNTGNQSITGTDVPGYLTIKLTHKAPELEAIVIEPYLKDGWQQWGRFFLENFIGTTAEAGNCSILNKDVIRFRHSKKDNRLTAHASEPLLIENKALGYRIRYQLETFRYDFQKRYVLYTGYPFFEELKGSNRKQKAWEKKRQETYLGSLMHFMRSVYRNTIMTEGFEVRHLQKVPNVEKQRVKARYRQMFQTAQAGNTVIVSGVNQTPDSAAYYEEILRQPDEKDVIGREVLPGDSIAFAVDSVTAGLYFPHHLYVNYKKGAVPVEYKQLYPSGAHAMLSHIFLLDGQAVTIQANGMYYDPAEVVSSGYWGWSEKVATMLPYDFKPKE